MGGGKESNSPEDISKPTDEYRRSQRTVSTGGTGRGVQPFDHLERIITPGDALPLYQSLPPTIMDLPS